MLKGIWKALLLGCSLRFELTNNPSNLHIPKETALRSLLNHITGGANENTFQPMNINFGLFPPIENKVRGEERKAQYSKRALEALSSLKPFIF